MRRSTAADPLDRSLVIDLAEAEIEMVRALDAKARSGSVSAMVRLLGLIDRPQQPPAGILYLAGTPAEIRLADEIDAGQKDGRVATVGRPEIARSSGNIATLDEIGIKSQRVAEPAKPSRRRDTSRRTSAAARRQARYRARLRDGSTYVEADIPEIVVRALLVADILDEPEALDRHAVAKASVAILVAWAKRVLRDE